MRTVLLKFLPVLLRFLAIMIGLIFVLGLIGAFGITTAGTEVFARFATVMGKFAWIGPFLSAVLAYLLWHISGLFPLAGRAQAPAGRSRPDHPDVTSRPQSPTKVRGQVNRRSGVRSNVRPSRNDEPEKLALPPGKLVTLRGFREYFASPDWVEVKSPVQDFTELGKDFPTYFGEGTRFAERIERNLTTIRGFRNYFEQVNNELANERESIPATNSPQPPKNVVKSPVSRLEPTSTGPAEMTPEHTRDGGSNIAEQTGQDPVEPLSKHATSIPGQLAGLVQGMLSSKGVLTTSGEGITPEEREVLLGKPKILPLRGDPPVFAPKFNDHLENAKHPKFEPTGGQGGMDTSAFVSQPGSEKGAPSGKLNSSPEHIDGRMHSNVLRQPGAELNEATLSKPQGIWQLPTLDLLNPCSAVATPADPETPNLLERVLQDFGVKAKVIRVTRGPVITRYELAPAPGVKISKIVNLADDIALALAARDVRIEAPIPGKSAIGIEVPNKHPRTVPFREVIGTNTFRQNPSKLRVALGKDIADQPVIADLGKMPHLLVAGATGSGKSVCITTLINSLLFNATPAEVRLLLVDPKMVELSHYNGVPHLLSPVVTDPQKAAAALKWIVKEMETRYELFAAAGVRDIERYNQVRFATGRQSVPLLPWVVVVIDELADLMLVAAADVEESICRLAQMARAAGIHLVLATQRPSVDVITGLIKANIPSRISFAVSSQIDSRTILDCVGAEKLLGKGDMLYSPQGLNKPIRVQGCFLSDEEVRRVIQHWQSQGRPEYLDPEKLFNDSGVKGENGGTPEDNLFYEAGELLISTGMASVTFLQRRLKLGYARAARLMDQLEDQGVVGGYEGSKPRQILLTLEEFRQRFKPET